MKINKINNKITGIEENIQIVDLVDFANFILKFQEMINGKNNQLSKVERNFLVTSIIAKKKGYTLYNKECVEYFINNSEFKTKFAIDKHRMKLIKKRWIKKEGHKFSIGDMYDPIEYSELFQININIKTK